MPHNAKSAATHTKYEQMIVALPISSPSAKPDDFDKA